MTPPVLNVLKSMLSAPYFIYGLTVPQMPWTLHCHKLLDTVQKRRITRPQDTTPNYAQAWNKHAVDTLVCVHAKMLQVKGKVHRSTGTDGPDESCKKTWCYKRVGGQRPAPAALPPREIKAGTYKGGLDGPRAGLNGCGKSRLTRIRSPDCPARSESKKFTVIQIICWYIYIYIWYDIFNPLKPKLNPICYLLALLGAHHFLHVSRIRVKLLTLRWLMSYIYGAPISWCF